MLLDKRITDLFSSCIYKHPIKRKRDTVLKLWGWGEGIKESWKIHFLQRLER